MVDLHTVNPGHRAGISGDLSRDLNPRAQQSSDTDNTAARDHRSAPDAAVPAETATDSGG